MNIKLLSADPMNDILEVMDFTDEGDVPEFPVDFVPPGEEPVMVNLCGAPNQVLDYVFIPTFPVSNADEVNRDRRRVLVSALLDIHECERNTTCRKPNAEFIVETTEDNRLEVTLGKISKKWRIKYNKDDGIGATPMEKEGDQWKCGTYIDYTKLLVEPIKN